jgi:hypothetical protein
MDRIEKYKEALFIVLAVRIVRRWKSRTFDSVGNPGGIEQFTLVLPTSLDSSVTRNTSEKPMRCITSLKKSE